MLCVTLGQEVDSSATITLPGSRRMHGNWSAAGARPLPDSRCRYTCSAPTDRFARVVQIEHRGDAIDA